VAVPPYITLCSGVTTYNAKVLPKLFQKIEYSNSILIKGFRIFDLKKGFLNDSGKL